VNATGSLSGSIRAAAEWLDGAAFMGHLCAAKPRDVDGIQSYSLGKGLVSRNGGEFHVTKSGVAVCIAFDTYGTLVTTRPENCPAQVHVGQRVIVGPLSLRYNGDAN
jgi:hypothetical protein